MTLQSNLPNSSQEATPSPQETPEPQAPAPVHVSDSEFSSGSQDMEGMVADLMGLSETDDELSPSQLREQAAAATPAASSTPAEPPAPAPAIPAQPQVPPAAAPAAIPQVAATPQPAAPPVGTPTPAPVAPVAGVAPTGEVPPVPVVAAPVAAPQAAPAPAPTAAPGDGNPFVQLGQAVRTNRAQLEAQLASQTQFTPEQVQEFHEAPEKFLPKLVAKIQLDMVENTLGVMAQQIPVAVSSVMAIERESSKLENEFFARWPQLQKDNPQHTAVIEQIGRAYVQANPTSNQEQRRINIGAQAVVALNLIPTQAPPQVAAPVVQPTPAFTPAAVGSPAPAPNGQLGGWELFDHQLGNFGD